MNLKIFTNNIEQEALNQINTLISQPAFSECKVRIMPDVHAGAGCVIGFTADLGEKVIPNIVGVDIGCGMLTVELGQIDIDYAKLDTIIHSYIPSGRDVHGGATYPIKTMKQLIQNHQIMELQKHQLQVQIHQQHQQVVVIQEVEDMFHLQLKAQTVLKQTYFLQ